ncbi:MAG: ATP-dependent DNA helicase [Gammaproteobacteria bacterium]|nr:ATP-dependent DNA helicase [Gammaproteobacteria bacterium]MBU1655508.1 ATP-dependent DNA helicase [Gammaproteobacteria bacterium]MBU1961256.1 ATP-dependent DNA helicase [Gammaproteobacteria bacterium]
MNKEMHDIFSPDGLLVSAIPGFSHRRQQAEMAEAVAGLIASGGVLVAEAGTGTGKTFAYLAPAILSKRKVIVSTGTKNLQDQLFNRDLPTLRKALGVPLKAALLKGRSNYLCLHRLGEAHADPRSRTREMEDLLSRAEAWCNRTQNGDIAELSDIPENAPLWPLITSSTDNCLGQECPVYGQCHLVEARKRAQEADLVVINHHLLCADFALKEEGFGELLPDADLFIIDEAHQLPEVAGDFFGDGVGGRQLTELARDTEIAYHKEAGDMPALLKQCEKLTKAARDLRLLFGLDLRRGAWREVEVDSQLREGMGRTRQELAGLIEKLKPMKGRGKGLDSCLERAETLLGRWDRITQGEDAGAIRWFETHTQSFRINRTPLEIAGPFEAAMARHPASWVFTSATLAVGESFDLFRDQLGLRQAETARWDSPFDFPSQALWYVPRGLPEPSSPYYTEAVIEQVQPVLQASRGRAFLLFTSHRALQTAARLLKGRAEFPLFIQGDAPKAELVERFRASGNGVLLGTSSFWEGVDVKGEALSCVVIDKLPFASPGDPVLQARLDAMKRRGGNPFLSYQVPQAAIALKQGAGRLIRDVADRGLLMICDPRLLRRGYGHIFLDSMPPFARTRELTDVEAFFELR